MTVIKVTKNAWRKIDTILKTSNNKLGFLYSASSGGCNGFNFELNLIKKVQYEEIIKKKYYTVLSNNDSKLYVDPLSELFLLGTTIDFIQEDYNKGIFESKFKFEINKDLMTSCGCGISFNPKSFTT
ncbi:hypothetical protein CMK20_18995 [Candidatus Poribacteria bacterium]|nr:hypothetical protein [Candidatus Poribacteria bacterium]